CPECKNVTPVREHKLNAYTCPHCNYHDKIGSEVYFELLFDDNKFKELSHNMRSADPLGFVDTKPYPVRIATSIEKTGLKDAVRTAVGKMNGMDIVIACMDSNFIGGSMGSVVGEKIARSIYYCSKMKYHILILYRQ